MFNFFKKTSSDLALEKFEIIKKSVQEHTEFLLDENFKQMSPEEGANKIMYQVIDKSIREKLTEEENKKLDKENEFKNLLNALKQEFENGHITNTELETIINSEEFKEYANNS